MAPPLPSRGSAGVGDDLLRAPSSREAAELVRAMTCGGVEGMVRRTQAAARAHAALLRFGHAANEANDIGGALDAFESAFELQPGDAAAFLSAANMRLKLGHVEMAHAMYTWLLDQRRIPLAPRHVEMASRKLKAMGAPRTKDPPAEDSPDSITARLRRRYGDAGGETAAAVRSAETQPNLRGPGRPA